MSRDPPDVPEVVPVVMIEPSTDGRFGRFGGRFVPETLVPACEELEAAFRSAWGDAEFRTELDRLLRDYAGRPSPVTECANLSAELGCRVLLKREDLNHTGSHKINNVIGQALLARRMGKTRLVAETGACQPCRQFEFDVDGVYPSSDPEIEYVVTGGTPETTTFPDVAGGVLQQGSLSLGDNGLDFAGGEAHNGSHCSFAFVARLLHEIAALPNEF